jgi:hypothetical protein
MRSGSFLDFLSLGCQIVPIVAIDFTASNQYVAVMASLAEGRALLIAMRCCDRVVGSTVL